MRRFLSIITITALVIGALTPVAAAAMWYRSWRAADTFTVKRQRVVAGRFRVTAYSVMSGRGVVGLISYAVDVGLTSSASRPAWRQFGCEHSVSNVGNFEVPRNSSWERAGFGRYVDTLTATNVGNTSGVTHVWWIPYWALMLALMAVPGSFPTLVAVRRSLRRRGRTRRGECVRCGYDLRGTSGHCPSCGIEVPSGSGDRPCAACGLDLTCATWRCPECGTPFSSKTALPSSGAEVEA